MTKSTFGVNALYIEDLCDRTLFSTIDSIDLKKARFPRFHSTRASFNVQ